jgi:hypothetical protein
MSDLTLALKLCFHKPTTGSEDKSHWAELKEACLMLQESRIELPTADRFVALLMELLRKHKIQLQDAGPQYMYLTPSNSAGTPGPRLACTAVPPTDWSAGAPMSNLEPLSWPMPMPDLSLDFDSLWEDIINMAPDSAAPEYLSMGV